MTTKRELDELDEGELSDEQPSCKRVKQMFVAQPRRQPRHQHQHQHQHQNSAIDPTWGQKYVFSDAGDASTIPVGEESDFEDDADAMAYLLSVRKEATGIPHLLVAPKPPIGPQLPPELHHDYGGTDVDADNIDDGGGVQRVAQANGIHDPRAYYDDGAYIARPVDADEWGGGGNSTKDGEQDGNSVQEAYFASILDRHYRLRAALHSKLPSDAASRLSSTHPTYAPPLGRKSSTAKTWSRLVRTTDPHPIQLALMSKDSVLRVLHVILGGPFLRRGHTLSERTSLWLWGLLARLPGPGELSHREMAWVRDLGRRAVLLSRSMAEMAALRDELEEGGLGIHDRLDASGDGSDVGDKTAAAADNDDDNYADAEKNGEKAESHPTQAEAHAIEAADDAEASVVVAEAAPRGHEDGTGPAPSRHQVTPKAHLDTAEPGSGDGVQEGSDSNSCSGSVAMEMASDSAEEEEALEKAKRAMLLRLEDAGGGDKDTAPPDDGHDEVARLRLRQRINRRATLIMLLTITGDFYGQRDLLDFREPFIGL